MRGLLADPAFRRLWLVGTLTSTVRWLEMLAVGVFVFDRTGSPSLTALMLVLRLAPLALFGVFGGALAERFPRRGILVAGLWAMTAVSLALALLAWTGRLTVWEVGLGAFLSGVFWVTDFPVRRTLLGEAAGTDRIGRAMSLDTVTNNGTRMLGPLLGGGLLELIGMGGAYVMGAGLYAGSALLCLRLAPEPPRARMAEPVATTILEGFRHLGRSRPLLATLAVTVVFNLFGFPMVSMVPVIGREVLALPPSAVGLLAASEGAGAFTGSLVLAALARPPWFRSLYLGGVATYLAMALLFAAAAHPLVSAAFLLGLGLGGAAFSSMQSTLVMLSSPPAIRSRMMGVLSVCIGTGPLGFLHLGWLADALGPSNAVALIAIEGLLALTALIVLWPEDTGARPQRSRLVRGKKRDRAILRM